MATAHAHCDLQPSPDEVRRFLSEIVSDSIHLVAIVPDGPTKGRWFSEDAAAATAWAIAENLRGLNVYWTVNRCRPDVHKKCEKTDILAARFAHVDIDPPKEGGTLDFPATMRKLKELPCPPSFIVHSGNGLQPFWRLDEDVENWAAIEAVNLALRAEFTADACHCAPLPEATMTSDHANRTGEQIRTHFPYLPHTRVRACMEQYGQAVLSVLSVLAGGAR